MEIHFCSYFHFKWFLGRERERERARGRRGSPDHAFDIAGEPRAPIRRSHTPDRTGLVDRNTAPIAPRRSISWAPVQRSHAPDRTSLVDCSTAPIAPRHSISPPRDLTFDPPIFDPPISLSLCDFDFCCCCGGMVMVFWWLWLLIAGVCCRGLNWSFDGVWCWDLLWFVLCIGIWLWFWNFL